MKKCYKKGLVLGALLLLASCVPVESPFGGDIPPKAFYGSFLSAAEQAMVDEANFARTEPKRYVSEVLQPFMDRCDNSPDPDSAYCVDYVKTAIDTMNAMDPVGPLQPSLGLTLATRDFIADPGRNVHASTSAGFGSFSTRAGHYGDPGIGRIGENAWPTTVTGRDQYDTVVSGWIIDGGVVGFGHRKILLDKKYYYIGIGFGYGASNAETENYRNRPAAYATLASAVYTEKTDGSNYKDSLALHNGSIAKAVTWPVLRYVDGQYIEFDTKGRAGSVVGAP